MYIFKSILHDWDDEQAIKILKNCRNAIADNGKLLLIERVIPTGNVPSPGKIMDIVMLVNIGGMERTSDEYEVLLEESDFKLVKTIPTESEMTILECMPA